MADTCEERCAALEARCADLERSLLSTVAALEQLVDLVRAYDREQGGLPAPPRSHP